MSTEIRAAALTVIPEMVLDKRALVVLAEMERIVEHYLFAEQSDLAKTDVETGIPEIAMAAIAKLTESLPLKREYFLAAIKELRWLINYLLADH